MNLSLSNFLSKAFQQSENILNKYWRKYLTVIKLDRLALWVADPPDETLPLDKINQ